MIDYLVSNIEWIFSGIGVALISWIFFSNKQNKIMRQKSGDNSINIQVGGDIKSSFRNKDDGIK